MMSQFNNLPTEQPMASLDRPDHQMGTAGQFMANAALLDDSLDIEEETVSDDVELGEMATSDDALTDDNSLMGDEIKSTRFRKLQKKLRKLVSWAIRDYNMIEDGDIVMVCISGGKDSFTLLDILLFLKRIAPINFEVIAVNLDQKQPGYPEDVLPNYLTQHGIPYYILEKDTYSVVKQIVPEGKTYCSACSRLRRGSLYGFAKQIGATKIALGHHRDDMMATFFLNLFHGGSIKSMPPKLLSDDKQNVLIRPLAYVEEKDIIKYARYKNFPIIPCNLCGSQENLQRAMINDMLREWDRSYPNRLNSIFNALQNVAPSQLADRNLFDFEALKLNRDDDISVFTGENIQAGMIDEVLQQKGVPSQPQVQTFNPNQSKQQPNDSAKIPTINPLI